MKRRCLSKPFIVLIVVAVATAGLFLIPTETGPTILIGSPVNPNLGVADPSAARSLRLRPRRDYPVTGEMHATADGLAGRRAPEFSLEDATGTTHSLASLAKGKPALLFFIEKECACCLGAKYFVDRLAGIHADTAVVIGIINASGSEAAKWRRATRPQFTVLEDPNQIAIRAYGAERCVYTTLVRPDGIIDKAYPGYSRQALDEISRRLSKLAGVQERPFLSPVAPERMTSGCLFPEPSTESNKS